MDVKVSNIRNKLNLKIGFIQGFHTYNGPFGEKDVSTPPTAKIPACGGFITAVNSVIPNMPKFDTLNKNNH